MKKTEKKNALQGLSEDEILVKITEVRKELNDLRLRNASKVEVEKPGRISELRHDIARMLTVLTQLKKEAK